MRRFNRLPKSLERLNKPSIRLALPAQHNPQCVGVDEEGKRGNGAILRFLGCCAACIAMVAYMYIFVVLACCL